MKHDTEAALRRFEEELLAQQESPSAPAFEYPEDVRSRKDPKVYANYANDYGRELRHFARSGGKLRRRDPIGVLLNITICLLCLGIIGVMIYWVQNLL